MPGLETPAQTLTKRPAPRAHEHYGRRWSTSLFLSLVLHATAFLVTARLLQGGDPAGGGDPGGDGGGAGSGAETALQGIVLEFPAHIEAAPDVVAPTPPAPAVLPELDPSAEAVDIVPQSSVEATAIATSGASNPGGDASPPSGAGTGGDADAGAGGPGVGGTGGSAGPGDAGPTQPIELAYDDVQLRVYVSPRPLEIVVKRKIADAVRLRALVGVDGSVRDVQILHAIPDCDECTRESIQAAYRVRFDPVFVDGRATPFWTTWAYTFGVQPGP